MLFVHLIYVLANYGAAPVALPISPAFAKKKEKIPRWMMMDNNVGAGGEMQKKKRNEGLTLVIVVHWYAWRQQANTPSLSALRFTSLKGPVREVSLHLIVRKWVTDNLQVNHCPLACRVTFCRAKLQICKQVRSSRSTGPEALYQCDVFFFF